MIPFMSKSKTGKTTFGGKKSEQQLPVVGGGLMGQEHEGTSWVGDNVPCRDKALGDAGVCI